MTATYGPRTAADRLPFAVYGTLRPGCGNDRLWQHTDTAVLADGWKVPGFRLVSNGAFPYALPTDGDEIAVTLLLPAEADYEDVQYRLDALEGVPHHYTREEVEVVDPARPGEYVVAWMYVPRDPSRMDGLDPVPGNDWYQRVREAWEVRR